MDHRELLANLAVTLRRVMDWISEAHPAVTEQDCRGWAFAPTARDSLAKLRSRAQDFLDGNVYRPTRPG